MAWLDPRSSEYRRLRRQIFRDTATLRHHEDERARRSTELGYAGVAFILIGGIVTFAAWGTWLILLGVGMALLGLGWTLGRRPGKHDAPGR